MSNDTLTICELCGEQMPYGEEMFKYHGHSGPCPKPPLQKPTADDEAIGPAVAREDDSTKRASVAYEAFRGGLIWGLDPEVPRWEDAPNWIRDVAVVAYLQGKLDAPKRS